MVDLNEALQYFMDVPSVTGFEEQRRKRIIEVFSEYCDTVTIDVIGNVIGVLGDGDRDVMLSGHYDQVGVMITYVQDNGYAAFKTVGGQDRRVVFGARVKAWIGDGPEDFIVGNVAVKPPNVLEPSDFGKCPKPKDMLLDLGLSSKEEADKLGIKSGTVCTYYLDVTKHGPTGSNQLIGPAFDDICCVAGLVKSMKLLKDNPPKNIKVHFVATVQEEIGSRGAKIAAFNIQPWVSIATDVTNVVSPGVTPRQVAGMELGEGPIINLGGNFTKALWMIMEEEASKHEIPYQRRGVPAGSGTDATPIQITRGGTINGLISMPLRYMHGPNEVINMTDLENLGTLIAKTVLALGESDLEHNIEVYRQ